MTACGHVIPLLQVAAAAAVLGKLLVEAGMGPLPAAPAASVDVQAEVMSLQNAACVLGYTAAKEGGGGLCHQAVCFGHTGLPGNCSGKMLLSVSSPRPCAGP
jgi:hypothetical protein